METPVDPPYQEFCLTEWEFAWWTDEHARLEKEKRLSKLRRAVFDVVSDAYATQRTVHGARMSARTSIIGTVRFRKMCERFAEKSAGVTFVEACREHAVRERNEWQGRERAVYEVLCELFTRGVVDHTRMRGRIARAFPSWGDERRDAFYRAMFAERKTPTPE